MIGIVSTLATGTCRHCGDPISLLKSDIERDAHWTHDPQPGTGRFQLECRGATYAEPTEDGDT